MNSLGYKKGPKVDDIEQGTERGCVSFDIHTDHHSVTWVGAP